MRPFRYINFSSTKNYHIPSTHLTRLVSTQAQLLRQNTWSIRKQCIQPNPRKIRRNFASSPLANISSEYKPDQRVLNLFYGFMVGIAFSTLYNREFPGYERRIRRKALSGNASAMVEYGQFLLSKKDSDPSSDRAIPRAFQFFQSASEQGNKSAHYYLGLMHKMKQIEAPNPKAAFHHFSIAANEDDEGGDHRKQSISQSMRMQSKYELGLCYLEGYGADRDTQNGLDILEEIGKDNGDSAYALSQIFANGRYGVSVDSIKALSWKRESAKLGNKDALEEMNELYLSKGRDLVDKEIPTISAYDGVKSAM